MQRFNIFVAQTIELATSLIIKSECIAEQMNLALTESGNYVGPDRDTWRYYLHLAGIKHAVDSPIVINSLDTGEAIELTLDNLARHKKTTNAYRANPSYINQLVASYPEYAVYIRAMFNPIPLSVSVNAEDCSILAYDTDLVEPQEQSLIYDLGVWLKSVHMRWMAEGWRVHNDAFVLAFYTTLWPAIPGKILELRFQNVHTPEAHSYHITEFLASHQGLHAYVPYMTRQQMFAAYRNIRVWERSSGLADTYEWLIDVFLTGWNMSAVAYSVSQEIQTPALNDDTGITPVPSAYRRALNYTELNSGRDLDVVDTSELINKEYSLATMNAQFLAEYQEDLDNRLSLTQFPDQSTKLVEITAIDPQTMERFDRAHNLFNEWLHFTALERYRGTHEVVNPTNGDTMKLTTKELVALYLYAAYRGYANTTLTKIPRFPIYGVLIKRWVGFDEMEGILMPSYPGRYDSLIHYYTDTHYLMEPLITEPAVMFKAAATIWQDKQRRYIYGINRRKLKDLAAAKVLFRYQYRDYMVDLKLPYVNYDMFFKTYGLDPTLISNDSWQDIATAAFNAGTDYANQTDITQTEIQAAMVALLTKLSSYSIHFAKSMDDGKYEVTDPLLPVLDDIEDRSFSDTTIIHTVAGPVDVEGKSSAKTDPVLAMVPQLPGGSKAVTVEKDNQYLMGLTAGLSVSVTSVSYSETSDYVIKAEVMD